MKAALLAEQDQSLEWMKEFFQEKGVGPRTAWLASLVELGTLEDWQKMSRDEFSVIRDLARLGLGMTLCVEIHKSLAGGPPCQTS